MTEEKKLRRVLAAIYERCSEEVRVNPAWLATQGMLELDPESVSPNLVYLAAHLELRQLARSLCRQKCEEDEGDTHDMFPDLQKRYPAARTPDDEPEYVLLDHMTKDDVEFNVNRLRSEAEAKQRHADALEAWWEDRAVA